MNETAQERTQDQQLAELQRQVDEIIRRRDERLTLQRENPPVAAPVEEDPSAIRGQLNALFDRLVALATPVPEEEYERRCFPLEITPRLEAWGFPSRFIAPRVEWGCVAQEKTFQAVQRLLRGTGAIIALTGHRGTGKTTIAAQLAIQRAQSDWRTIRAHKAATFREAIYRKLSDLIARLKPLYGDMGTIDTEDLMARRRLWVQADLAIIDEIHECDDIRMKDRVLTDLLDRRYSAERDTLIISNQTVEQFEATTNSSILSRINEHGAIIPCEWESWREK